MPTPPPPVTPPAIIKSVASSASNEKANTPRAFVIPWMYDYKIKLCLYEMNVHVYIHTVCVHQKFDKKISRAMLQ